MKKILYKLWSKFLTAFGNVKIFKYPFWIIYDPDDYEVTGEKISEILSILKPGDIVIRGYKHYLDGKFIPSKAGWSHGAIYVGDNQIIHAVVEGVQYINVIEFTRCDRIAVLRPRKNIKSAIKKAKQFVKNNIPYDFNFKRNQSALYCFELCGECYSKLNIKKKQTSALCGLFKKNVYLAESFFESPDFELILEFNPKTKKDFLKK
jgi:cell wall-associated NlpC family hydrolase